MFHKNVVAKTYQAFQQLKSDELLTTLNDLWPNTTEDLSQVLNDQREEVFQLVFDIMMKPELISDYCKLLISISYHADHELSKELILANALTPLMQTYTEHALVALTNFAFCEQSMAE